MRRAVAHGLDDFGASVFGNCGFEILKHNGCGWGDAASFFSHLGMWSLQNCGPEWFAEGTRSWQGLGSKNHRAGIQSAFHNIGMTVRRLKTYTGAQGYVYQYYFVGERPALPDDPEAPATEFVFDVTSDRKLIYAVSVFFPESTLTAWCKAHGRPLKDAEQYAAAKIRLFRAFDELEDVKAHGRRLSIDISLLEEALSSLGVE